MLRADNVSKDVCDSSFQQKKNIHTGGLMGRNILKWRLEKKVSFKSGPDLYPP